MLLDSNIIIYALQPQYAFLRAFIAKHAPVVSAVSMIETLGYHRITPAEKLALEQFFSAGLVLPISGVVVERAIDLRQQKKLSLGDSLVAATALVHQKTLVTRNTTDFDWIEGLVVFNPFDV
jgi:toxin FitB